MHVEAVPRLATGDRTPIVLKPTVLPALETALDVATAKSGLGEAYAGEHIAVVVRWDFTPCPNCGEAQLEKNVQLVFESSAQVDAQREAETEPCLDCATDLRDSVAAYLSGREAEVLGDLL